VVKAVFFDRDGVINHLVKHGEEYTAPWSLEEFKLMDGIEESIRLVRDKYLTLIVTNQPDVYDGKLSHHDLTIMMHRCLKLGIDDGLISFERGSAWYKPNNGMLETLIKQYEIDRQNSYIIGDSWKDIVAGHKSKISTIFIGETYNSPEKYKDIEPDYIVDNVLQAAILINVIDNFMEPQYD
jgi:HAD superfamily hydrolase (TIGR01662 family)